MPVDIKTVIIHCKSLKERKENVLQQMKKFGFGDYSFYEDFDGCELTQEIIDQYCIRKQNDPDGTEKKLAVYYPIIDVDGQRKRELNIAEVSLAIKHGKVLQALSQIDAEYFLILEDDVLLCEDFDVHFPHFLSQTPADWDAIYIGSGANLKPHHSRLISGQVAYLMDHPAGKCTDSIVMKKSAACDIASTWFPFHMPSDWEISYQHYLHNHKVYWWEPSLVRQGSEYGMFKSALR
jgi:GR25 family glycosyltransferase involved in LPS biosynthesis